MKIEIKFFWNNVFDEPWCDVGGDDSEVEYNLPSFLVDHEGLRTRHLQKWIRNGLNEMDKIKLGEIAEFDMWGQSLGAMISLDKVIVYWGNDEYPEQIMGFNAFYEILTRWLEYISAPVDVNREVIFFVDINV